MLNIVHLLQLLHLLHQLHLLTTAYRYATSLAMLHLLQLVLTAILSVLLFSIAITGTTWHWVLRAFHGVIHELLTRFLSKRGTVRSAFSVLRFQMVRKLLQVLQYRETILQEPEEETQGQTIVFTLTSQIMEIILTSRCVGVIFEWFHQLYPKQLRRASIIPQTTIIPCYNIRPLYIIVNLRSMEMLT